MDLGTSKMDYADSQSLALNGENIFLPNLNFSLGKERKSCIFWMVLG